MCKYEGEARARRGVARGPLERVEHASRKNGARHRGRTIPRSK